MTRVLLVEDSSDVLFVLQFELEAAGYEVDATTDAAVALNLAQGARPDVIVSDLRMPDIDGLEFMRRIRKISDLATVPAIVLTGAGMEKDIRQALDAGFTAHLTKPVEAQELIRKIEQLTARNLKRQAG
jgi:two-component system, chemotaxis family, CheB/CheR fusion protein